MKISGSARATLLEARRIAKLCLGSYRMVSVVCLVGKFKYYIPQSCDPTPCYQHVTADHHIVRTDALSTGDRVFETMNVRNEESINRQSLVAPIGTI